MVETTTKNYGWVKPEIAGSPSSWGGFLNSDLDSIDALVFANQQAAVPIGAITMFGGATPPPNWVICDGTLVATTGTYAALFAVIGYTYGGGGGAFNLPNMTDMFPIGAETVSGSATDIGEHGGSYTYTLDVAHLPSHAHPIVDVAHTHGASQPAHNHGDAGHSHGASQDPHAHTVPNVPLFTAGGGVAGGSGAQLGNQTTSSAQPNVSVGTGYANLFGAQPAVNVNPSGTGLSTTQNIGSGAAMTILPQYLVLNFIIRFQ